MDTRTTRERVDAVERGGGPITEKQRSDATALLDDLLAAATQHDVTLDDFDWVSSLDGVCLDVILAQARQRGER